MSLVDRLGIHINHPPRRARFAPADPPRVTAAAIDPPVQEAAAPRDTPPPEPTGVWPTERPSAGARKRSALVIGAVVGLAGLAVFSRRRR